MRNFVFKILVAGDGAVGKTTLLRKFVDGTFDESSITTVGVDFFIKQVIYENVGNCTLQLWDLGGQERFRHLLESFVMGAKGALLLFDLTQMPKIDNILNWVNIYTGLILLRLAELVKLACQIILWCCRAG